MQPEDERRTRLAVLSALDAALADPVRLVRIVAGADDEDDAVRRLGAELGLDEAAARTVLGQQYASLTRSRRARLAEELVLLREPWGEPVEAALAVGPGSAVLTVDGTERTLRAPDEDALLDTVRQQLLEEVARPRRRPVAVAATGPARGPALLTVLPTGSMRLDDRVVGRPTG